MPKSKRHPKRRVIIEWRKKHPILPEPLNDNDAVKLFLLGLLK